MEATAIAISSVRMNAKPRQRRAGQYQGGGQGQVGQNVADEQELVDRQHRPRSQETFDEEQIEVNAGRSKGQ
jgi:hypothetical protein